MPTALPDGFRLVGGSPNISEYLDLRLKTGLSPKTESQASAGITGSWYACHIIHEQSGRAVGMGRVVGDGGWYFHIIDMAVSLEYQQLGLGSVILETMLDRIRTLSPPGAYVNLIGSHLGKKLYRKYGFVETAPDNVGMELRMPYATNDVPMTHDS